MTAANKEIFIPALRGIMGEWVYYSCLIPLKELSDRVSYASELHTNKGLSDLIQRELKKSRSKDIANYLKNQEERFFNSLVVAVYKGEPKWYDFGDIKPTNNNVDMSLISGEAQRSLGFLRFSGKENLFALDGQHRLAGIKEAYQSKDFSSDDEVSVLFVAHEDTRKGLIRTRRLFTTLNKTAKPVTKGEIIALDEDDTMAIIIRKFLQKNGIFEDKKIAIVANNNMPVSNKESLTTIGNLYDILKILFTSVESDLKKKLPDLQFNRMSDEELDKYHKFADKYFLLMARSFSELDEFFKSKNYATITNKYRKESGGKVLFRPIGLILFTEIIAYLSKEMSIENAIKLASKLPGDLDKEPYLGLMWSDGTKTMSPKIPRPLLRNILLYMLDFPIKDNKKVLESKYRDALDDQSAALPNKVN